MRGIKRSRLNGGRREEGRRGKPSERQADDRQERQPDRGASHHLEVAGSWGPYSLRPSVQTQASEQGHCPRDVGERGLLDLDEALGERGHIRWRLMALRTGYSKTLVAK